MFEYIVRESAAIQREVVEKEKLLDFLKEDKTDKKIDEQFDLDLLEEINNEINLDDKVAIVYDPQPEKRSEPITKNSILVFPRDKRVAINALNRANHCCEISNSHPTFMRKMQT